MITLGMMCKAMKCTPTQLRKEDYEDIEYLTHVFNEISKKNPMSMLM